MRDYIFILLSFFCTLSGIFLIAFNDCGEKDKISEKEEQKRRLRQISLDLNWTICFYLTNKLNDVTDFIDSLNIAHIPISYSLNNRILLLSDKEEKELLIEVANSLSSKNWYKKIKSDEHNYLTVYASIPLEISSIKFANKKNHPYNFIEIEFKEL